MAKILQIIILIISSFIIMSASCDKGSEGCIDSNACNYDNTVAIDDGSCWSANEGCRCEHPFNSIADCLGVCDTDDENNPPDDNGDGICNEDVIGGCIDSTKYQNKYLCNYSPNATHNNDSCAVDLSQFGGDLNGNDCTYPLGGSCGGSAVMDECDLCIGGTTNYGKCWKIKIKSIATFKLKNGFPMGSDTSSITIGASKYALDGYNETVTDDGNTDCEENYNDVPGLLKTEMNSNKNNFINFFIPHDDDAGWDEWWGSHFNFNRDIRANDYHSLFDEDQGMNWFSVIEPTLSDTFIVNENELMDTYETIIDSIKFQITHLDGIQCSDIKIYLDREKGETDGGIEIENFELGIGVESNKEINVTINVSNICIQGEFDGSCPNY